MRQKSVLLIVLGCALFCGCEEYEYTIRMELDGNRVVRKIVCSGDAPEDLRARLKEHYSEQIDPNTFQGSFGELLPNDVGGFGTCQYLNNPMGEVHLYAENFRGNDSQAPDIEQAFDHADLFVDLLIDWLHMELGDHPNFEGLRTFCDESLREDLKNTSLYSWVGSRTVGIPNEAFMRIALYLYERGYFTMDDIAQLSTSTNNTEFAMSFFRQLIADKLKCPRDQATTELPFFQDPNSLIASLERSLAFPPVQDRIIHMAREQSGDPNLVLDPCDISAMAEDIPELFSGMVFIEFFDSGDTITVELVCPRQPFETNGQWDEHTKELNWSRKVGSDELPFLCYAALGLAHESFQTQHFGKVVLEDDQLLEYSTWYDGLTPEQQTEWDEFVMTLDGSDTVGSRVEAFRFTQAEPPAVEGDKDAKRLSDVPRDLMRNSLKPQAQGGQAVSTPESTPMGEQSFTVHAIGKVVKKDGKTFIVINEAYQAGLKGLERHAYVHVVYWFDKNDTPQKRAILEVHPRADKTNPLTGVFATHSPVRPNLLAITKCDIIAIKENVIEVKEIDAFDGSPVLDLKGDFFRFHAPKTE